MIKILSYFLIMIIYFNFEKLNANTLTPYISLTLQKQGWFFYNYKEDHPTTNSNQEFISEHAPLSSKWFKEALPFYLDKAMDDPSIDNVTYYLDLQFKAQQKSLKFSDMVEISRQGNPNLDTNLENPLVQFAQNYRKQLAFQNTKQILQKISTRSILIFFYVSNNHEVSQQANILQNLIKEIPTMLILPISLDGSLLKFNHSLDSVIDNGMSKKFKISGVPSLVLLDESGQSILVSAGGVSLEDLILRILLSTRKLNIISHQEFLASKGRFFSTIDNIK